MRFIPSHSEALLTLSLLSGCVDSCNPQPSGPKTETEFIEKEVDFGTQKDKLKAKTLLIEEAERFASEQVGIRTREIAELARKRTANKSPEAQAAMGERCESIIYQVERGVSPAPARKRESGYSIQEIAGATATLVDKLPMGTSSWGVYQDGIFKEGFSVTSSCLPAWTVFSDPKKVQAMSDLKDEFRAQGGTIDVLDLRPVLTDELINEGTQTLIKKEEMDNIIKIVYAPPEAN